MNDAIIGGMLMVSGAASAMTGGVTAGEGQTVVTGDSSASVQVTNVINADNDGGTSHTIVEKTINGVKTVTEETKEFLPGEPINVEVHAEAKSEGSEVSTSEIVSTGDTSEDTTATTSDEISTSTEDTVEAEWNIGSYLVDTISGMFTNLWDLLTS